MVVFRLDRRIHQGSYFEVWRCIDSNGAPRAVKMLACDLHKDDDSEYRRMLKCEADFLRSVAHENIISFQGFSADCTRKTGQATSNTPALVLELGCLDVMQLLQATLFEEDMAQFVIRGLLEAVKHLHGMQVAHLDLKPEQLVFSKSKSTIVIKLVDFGTLTDRTTFTTPVGTAGYIAPEILALSGEEVKIDRFAADMWSVGITLFVILCGFPPFNSPDSKDPLFRVFCDDRFKFWGFVRSRGVNLTAEAMDLIDRMTVLSPENRCTAEEAMEHPWMKKRLKIAKVEAELARRITRLESSLYLKPDRNSILSFNSNLGKRRSVLRSPLRTRYKKNLPSSAFSSAASCRSERALKVRRAYATRASGLCRLQSGLLSFSTPDSVRGMKM
mmetsp:Transcript_27333/g.48329  ORF Transcript_27333/g.48329 Transcript_27333/m.48329 type:complete len:387 (+) Transcript_27333:124-1284(+)